MSLQRTGPTAPAKFQSLASQGKFSNQSALRIMRSLRAGYKGPENPDDTNSVTPPDPNDPNAIAPSALPDTSQLAPQSPRQLFRGGKRSGGRAHFADDGTSQSAPTDPNTPSDPTAQTGLTAPQTGLTRAMAPDLASNSAPAPQQVETANPLTGDGNAQPEESSTPVGPGVNPARALGFSSRGTGLPKGDDIATTNDDDEDKLQHVGGSGSLAKRFSNPTSANIYGSFVKGLFGGSATGFDDDANT